MVRKHFNEYGKWVSEMDYLEVLEEKEILLESEDKQIKDLKTKIEIYEKSFKELKDYIVTNEIPLTDITYHKILINYVDGMKNKNNKLEEENKKQKEKIKNKEKYEEGIAIYVGGEMKVNVRVEDKNKWLDMLGSGEASINWVQYKDEEEKLYTLKYQVRINDKLKLVTIHDLFIEDFEEMYGMDSDNWFKFKLIEQEGLMNG